MRPDSLQFSHKWFIAAAVFAFAIGSLFAVLLLPRGRSVSVRQSSDDREPALRQMAISGSLIPWGGTAPEDSVRLEVLHAAERRYDGLEVLLNHEDDRVQAVPAKGFQARLARLQPGRYRWSAKLHNAETGETAILAPPRGDPSAPDFIIPPPLFTISTLQQNRLDGAPLEAYGETESGAFLTGFTDYPAAVMEVEVKPAAAPFDEQGLIRAPVNDGAGKATFQGQDGSYHWRARLAAPAGKTEWQGPEPAPEGSFKVYHTTRSREPVGDERQRHDQFENSKPGPNASKKPNGSRPHENPNSRKRQEPDGRQEDGSAISNTFSSALPGASHEPLPSEHKPLPSAWGLGVFRMLAGIGTVVLTLTLAVLAVRLKTRLFRHPS